MAAKARNLILRRLVVLNLVATVLALAPAAHASLPDQSWIGGLYDNADFDDVIHLITGNLSAIQPTLGGSLGLAWPVASFVTPKNARPRPLSPLAPAFSRAPPVV